MCTLLHEKFICKVNRVSKNRLNNSTLHSRQSWFFDDTKIKVLLRVTRDEFTKSSTVSPQSTGPISLCSWICVKESKTLNFSFIDQKNLLFARIFHSLSTMSRRRQRQQQTSRNKWHLERFKARITMMSSSLCYQSVQTLEMERALLYFSSIYTGYAASLCQERWIWK